MGALDHRRIAIACQGGGSHTAFTAGVLARLFEDELSDGDVVGLSGTSGGAVCALLAWWALRSGDRAAVGPLLERFWADNSATTPWGQLLNAAATFAGDLQQFVMTPALSPYENPFATGPVVQNDVQASRKQNPEGCIRQARLEQNLAKQNLADPARLAKPGDLSSGQRRKCLCLIHPRELGGSKARRLGREIRERMNRYRRRHDFTPRERVVYRMQRV